MEAGLCFKTKREAIDNKEKTIKIWSNIKDKYKQQLVKEHKHGRWINNCCSICNAHLPSLIGLDLVLAKDFKYCYNCGAEMDSK